MSYRGGDVARGDSTTPSKWEKGKKVGEWIEGLSSSLQNNIKF